MKAAALCRRFFTITEEKFYFFLEFALFFAAEYDIMLNGRARLCPYIINKFPRRTDLCKQNFAYA